MVRQIDIFASAGLRNPDISIPSDEFLAEVEGMPQKNLAFELLRKLLNDEIRTRGKRNVVEARPFKQLLQQAVQKHRNRAVETTEIIRELIEPAQQMREASRRGEKLNWNADNRLTAVTPVSPQAGDKKVEFAYDYLGRRVEKKVYDWDDQAGDWEATPPLHRKFVWGGTGGSSASGWLLLLELEGGTGVPPVETVVRKYTRGLDLAGMSVQNRDRKGAGMSGQSRDREGADAACGAAALQSAGGTLDKTPSRQGQVGGPLPVLNAAEEAGQAPTK